MKNLLLFLVAATSIHSSAAFECKAGYYLCRRYMSLPDAGVNSICIMSSRRTIAAVSDAGSATEFMFTHRPHWRGCTGVIGFRDCLHELVEITDQGMKAVRRSVINRVRSETIFEFNFSNGEANLTDQERDTDKASFRSYVCERLYADYRESNGRSSCSQNVQ